MFHKYPFALLETLYDHQYRFNRLTSHLASSASNVLYTICYTYYYFFTLRWCFGFGFFRNLKTSQEEIKKDLSSYSTVLGPRDYYNLFQSPPFTVHISAASQKQPCNKSTSGKEGIRISSAINYLIARKNQLNTSIHWLSAPQQCS
jgi:hypothetical protein